jgi:hypothetical protein
MDVLNDNGGKHYESRWTKFFQSYFLVRRFGYDKRRAHLASLVVTGEMDRAEADGFLEESSGLTLALDDEFISPSQAAMALLARTANGRSEWNDAKGATLKEHQERAAAAASADAEP